MSCQEGVYQWTVEVQQHLPHLRKPQAAVLALWSFGMVLAQSCALTAVSLVLAAGLDRKENSVRQQLREACYEASAKRGQQRQALNVTSCFVPLLRWVLEHWTGTQLALAIDASSLGDRFTVLAVSVVYRGCAIPVAWTIVPATAKHAWRPEWLRLLRLLRPAIPRHYTVLVLADRGLYAPWLFRRIVRLGWHPCLRVNLRGSFRPACHRQFAPLPSFVPQPGTRWRGRGTAFKTKQCQLSCTLLALWEEGYADPWLVLTDLAPETADACWYGLRTWIEQGFKLSKRGGWQWQRTRMRDPARAARLWLAVALATLWLVRVGGEADAKLSDSPFPPFQASWGTPHRQRRATRLRLVGLFRRGWVTILVALLNHTTIPLGAWYPEPWPAFPALPAATTTDLHGQPLVVNQETYP